MKVQTEPYSHKTLEYKICIHTQKQPIRMLYPINEMFWLDNFEVQDGDENDCEFNIFYKTYKNNSCTKTKQAKGQHTNHYKLKNMRLNLVHYWLHITRGVAIYFFHKRYVSRYLICITIRFIGGNCNYSLKSMQVDMGVAMFFLYEVVYVLAKIINIWYLIN